MKDAGSDSLHPTPVRVAVVTRKVVTTSHGHGDRNSDSDGDRDVVRLSVPGMDCPSCAGKVETASETRRHRRHRRRVTTGTLTVEYDGGTTSADEISNRVEKAGYAVENDCSRTTLSVPDMDCASCAGKIENALDGFPGSKATTRDRRRERSSSPPTRRLPSAT